MAGLSGPAGNQLGQLVPVRQGGELGRAPARRAAGPALEPDGPERIGAICIFTLPKLTAVEGQR